VGRGKVFKTLAPLGDGALRYRLCLQRFLKDQSCLGVPLARILPVAFEILGRTFANCRRGMLESTTDGAGFAVVQMLREKSRLPCDERLLELERARAMLGFLSFSGVNREPTSLESAERC